jgi:hypothetical protein
MAKRFEATIWSAPSGIGAPVKMRGAARLAWHHEFVPGREDDDIGAARNRHLGNVHRRKERKICGPQPSRRIDHVAHREVAPARAHVAAAVSILAQNETGRVGVRVLLDDDAVGALGHRRAGEDAHGLSGPDRAGKAKPRP